MIPRRGFLKRIMALVALPTLFALPAPRAGASARPAARVVGGWVLTERDLTEIARLDR
jgi:hypothetical protein